MNDVFAELNERGDRICVYFRYDEATVAAVKAVPGSRFVPRDKGGPFWQFPLEIAVGRQLREALGSHLKLGDDIRAWGRREVREHEKLMAIATADDWPISDLVIKDKLPELAKWFRPYQRADVKFLSTTSALNLLEPRLGKTTETIAGIYEGDLEDGPHLVVAPQKTLDSVWRYEWERWTTIPVFTFSGETDRRTRALMWGELDELYEKAKPFVLVTTADMIRRGLFWDIEKIFQWNTFTIDEFHKTGLPNASAKRGTGSKFADAVRDIKAHRRFALSGTPMGGKPIKLWGALHFLRPDIFNAKWRWAEQWLNVSTDSGHKSAGDIKWGLEDKFYEHLAPFVVRRLREEVLPHLPKKQWVNVWCNMTKSQAKQYNKFAADAEVRIDEYHLTATNVLAEYTRLKQFANARCNVEIISEDAETGLVEMKVKPTFDSGKLPYLMEKLAEDGIDPKDMVGDTQVIVASQFRETVEMVYNYLTEQGIPCIRITGKVTKAESDRAQRTFRHGGDNEGLRVCCMVTTLGMGITLNNVETIHALDETWNPDDLEQLTDRAIDTNRIHQVTVLVYRSNGTIERYVYDVTSGKSSINKEVLDARRRGFRANKVKS